MKIGIPKERREGELRAAATPDTVKRYKALGLEPVVESGAGAGAAIARRGVRRAAGATIGDEAAVWASRHRAQGAAPDRGGDGPAAGRARS